jgi:hypothetical protein
MNDRTNWACPSTCSAGRTLDPEKAAKPHYCISDLAGIFIDHQVMDRAQSFGSTIVYSGPFYLFGGNQPVGLVGF